MPKRNKNRAKIYMRFLKLKHIHILKSFQISEKELGKINGEL